MGTDIHMHAEVRDTSGTWKLLRTYINQDRNYTFFEMMGLSSGILGQLRRKLVHSHIIDLDTHPYVVQPVSELKGIPDDLSDELKYHEDCSYAFSDEYTDYHSHTWFSLRELQAYNWERHLCIKEIVSGTDVDTMRTDPDVILIELGKEEDLRYLFTDKGEQIPEHLNPRELVYYKDTRFSVPYRHLAGTFYTETLPYLQSRIPEHGTPDDVRIIVYFDN